MKTNLPVTQAEARIPKGHYIVSRTDLKGITTYVNETFVAVSGFSRDELIGKNHNVVRHPDMLPGAFQWLWDTIKEGRPWRGIVKNRCKNGDFYWVDALVVPTSPTIHTLEEMKQEPVRFNSQFGTYTNFTNLADLSALAVPAPFRADGLPAGITLIAPAWHDRALADFGIRWQRQLGLPLGATGQVLSPRTASLPRSDQHVRIAVVGAHLRGMPLNFQLTNRNAVFVEATETAPCYRLFALANTQPAKPGIARQSTGAAIAVELWDIPLARFGEFVVEIPSPLGIGTIELCDGRWVKGFICEPAALSDATDITEFKGWRNWIARREARHV